MKTVYRVEHIRYRHGPYYASYDYMTERSEILAERLNVHCDSDRHPSPCEDGIDSYPYDDYYCGFESLDALFDWFEDWLDELEEYDYHVAVYNVKDCDIMEGGRQIMFRRKRYRRIASLQMSEVQQ